MTDSAQVPYEELDAPVVELVRALNHFQGIRTAGSCGGHEGGFSPPEEWYVTIRLELADGRPTIDAYLSLEFIAWAIYDMRKAGYMVFTSVFALPPFVNHPGTVLTFELSGNRVGDGRPAEPDEVAEFLNETRERFFEEGGG